MSAPAQSQRVAIEIQDVTVADLDDISQGNIDLLAPFHDEMEFQPFLPDRIARQSSRLALLLSNPLVQFRKAVLKEDPTKLAGIALWMWTPAGQKPQNLKRRFLETLPRTEDDDEDLWKGLDWEKWNKCWDEWDAVRDRFMNRREHWYLVPLWVKNEYQGQGIGRQLLIEKINECEQASATVPIYLEASKDGKPLYEKLGFEQFGESYYKEMIRWGTRGNEDDLARTRKMTTDYLAETGRTRF
ncbi:uncharacterized protein JCM15063_002182 [Sporobolomyces koalae]|uniref:uncharacterized protein n=1 Tax=Sporobolomyces koalae TaxID=500713 RepID=UPI0031828AED